MAFFSFCLGSMGKSREFLYVCMYVAKKRRGIWRGFSCTCFRKHLFDMPVSSRCFPPSSQSESAVSYLFSSSHIALLSIEACVNSRLINLACSARVLAGLYMYESVNQPSLLK